MSLKDQIYQIPVNAARQCATCKNHIPSTWTCKAFPKGITEEIYRGRHDHSQPFPGDNGILYNPDDPKNPQSAPYVGRPLKLY